MLERYLVQHPIAFLYPSAVKRFLEDLNALTLYHAPIASHIVGFLMGFGGPDECWRALRTCHTCLSSLQDPSIAIGC